MRMLSLCLCLLALSACSEDPSSTPTSGPSATALADSLPAALQAADRQAEAGDTAGALAATDLLLRRYPNSLDALLLKAELLTASGREGEALPILETAYRYAPGDPEVAHQLAFAYAEAGNEKALALSDSLIRADERATHGEPYYFKGIYYANRGARSEALQQFDESIRHDYNFIDAYMDKGRLQLESGSAAAALATFELAARVQPTFADAYHWMGRSLEALGRRDEAQANYQRAKGLEGVGSR